MSTSESNIPQRKPSNPPAFARAGSEDRRSGTLCDGDDYIREQEGMTLRDYFAAAALTGLMALDFRGCEGNAAACAFDAADAMLVARETQS